MESILDKFLDFVGGGKPRRYKIYLCFIAIIMFSSQLAFGQDTLSAHRADSSISFIKYTFFEKDHFSKNIETEFNFKSMKPTTLFPKHTVTGVFCKMEHRIEATSNFAPRFRLGSVNYTDWMEGKKSLLSRYAK
jgi:hypothetical protein